MVLIDFLNKTIPGGGGKKKEWESKPLRNYTYKNTDLYQDITYPNIPIWDNSVKKMRNNNNIKFIEGHLCIRTQTTHTAHA